MHRDGVSDTNPPEEDDDSAEPPQFISDENGALHTIDSIVQVYGKIRNRVTQSLVDCILTAQSTGRTTNSHHSARRKNSFDGKFVRRKIMSLIFIASQASAAGFPAPANSSCGKTQPAENQIIQSNRACVTITRGGITLRRQTQPADNQVNHLGRATVSRGTVSLGEMVRPITPGGNILRRQTQPAENQLILYHRVAVRRGRYITCMS